MTRRKRARFRPFWLNHSRSPGSGGNGDRLRGSGRGPNKVPGNGQKVAFEALEPRILLSTDLSFSGVAAFDLLLHLDDTTDPLNPVLKLIDSTTLSTVAEQALADTSAVVVTGSSEADRLTVDLSTPFSLPGGIVEYFFLFEHGLNRQRGLRR